MIRFRMQYKTVIVFFEWCRFSLAVVILLVFNIGLHDILLRFVSQDFSPVLDFFREFSFGSDLLIWIISKFLIQDIVWNSSMEYSRWFTTNARVIARIVIENR